MFKTRPANIKINSMLLVECQITSSFDFVWYGLYMQIYYRK